MHIYALLIGINDYPQRPLRQCINDVDKMYGYLESLKSRATVNIKSLKDAEASKENILKEIKDQIGQASDDDVALIYFSGHGAHEESGGHFPEEQDGLLECLVCYTDQPILNTGQLLADKELRYALSRLPANPHLITIVDACHSGDIVRSFHSEDEEEDDREVRRIAGAFTKRDFKEFIFANDSNIVHESGARKEVFIPFKNHIHLGACLSSESSWEDKDGGVFTRYLLGLLENTGGNLSYVDIARWAKISLQSVTKRQQTPVVTRQGKGPLTVDNSWLNLNPDGVDFPDGVLTNNRKIGWVYSRGSLLGVQPGMNVLADVDDDEVSMAVKSVTLDYSILEMPMSLINVLDTSVTYPAKTEVSTFNTLKLSFNPIEDESGIAGLLKQVVAGHNNVEIVDTTNADFGVNIFNGLVYFSLPEQEFQPLAQQISIDQEEKFLKSAFDEQLAAFLKWHHFYSLENPARDYDKSPLKIVVTTEDGSTHDVSNGTFGMNPREERLADGTQFQKVTIDVKNTSHEKLYVAVLTLNSDLSITSKPFEGRVVEIDSGQSKTMYDWQPQRMVYASMDQYKEIYNWKEEWFYYKFIFNNFDDFTAAFQHKDYAQLALNPPFTIDKETRSIISSVAKGEGGAFEEVKKKWGTCRTRIELANSTYNMITGDLKELWNDYAESEMLAPFIKELYFEMHFDGTQAELRLKQNRNQTADQANRATDVFIVKLFNKLYNFARRRKFRRQRHKDGPIVVAEGDSWFLFPKPGVRDTLDYVMEKYRLLSLADAGDEIADYIKNNELIEQVEHHKPDFVLISGGGNDILGEQIKTILKKDVRNAAGPGDYILADEFQKKMDFLRNGYEMFFAEIKKIQPEVRIFVHGYDYVRSNPDEKTIKNGWANRYMIGAGIDNSDDRRTIIKYLVDTFNTMLQNFDDSLDHVYYVDHRGTVSENEWMDEIHPNNTGYGKVAQNFLNAMSN